jgi:hypothetical protein
MAFSWHTHKLSSYFLETRELRLVKVGFAWNESTLYEGFTGWTRSKQKRLWLQVELDGLKELGAELLCVSWEGQMKTWFCFALLSRSTSMTSK